MIFFVRSAVAFLLFFFPHKYSFAQSHTIKVEKGVSESLATHRRQNISEVRYQLFFDISSNETEKINASETMGFNLSSTNELLQIDFKASPAHLHYMEVNKKRVPTVFKNEHILVDQRYLHRGFNTISFQFTAGELSLNRNKDFLYTLLVPDRARTLFPCFDQPDFKASFQLTLALPLPWTAVTNAPLQDSSFLNGKKLYSYKPSDVFSTYLFSFVAGKFEKRTKEIEGRPFQFYYRETDSSKISLSMDTIFQSHANALKFMEDYTQIKLPFQKFDFVAIPDFQYGGMEHVGAIDYRAATLFLDAAATKNQLNARSNLMAHETAHMWFGNLVTMQWFNDVWMKEVFANFVADKMTGGAATNNEELKFLTTHFPAAYAIDRTAGANAIRQHLSNLQEAGTMYGSIIYDKAPVMMRQLERLMGASLFREGLRRYLKNYSFSNASWPDLIKILDELTPADLQAWNKVWVNTAGRPQLQYSLQVENKLMQQLVITQRGEQSSNYLLPQIFELALVYQDHVEEIAVNMNAEKVWVREAEGRPAPQYILFNSSGQGYGIFPIDKAIDKMKMVAGVSLLKNPVMRAAAYINWYENMLNANYWRPAELLNAYMMILTNEKEELNLNLVAGYCADIFWRLLPAANRTTVAGSLENVLWALLQKDSLPNNKKIFFKTFQSIALTPAALDSLYKVWKYRQLPQGMKLSEEDYTSLALNLAVKEYSDTSILSEQLKRITNEDRKLRLQFMMPALSRSIHVRDAFFASLKNEKTRKKESWVEEALDYLHHPLRAKTSIRYLKQSLYMLQQVQLTGDIFFPEAWLSSSFGSYQTREAAAIVRRFLSTHPSYNPKLKAKILQAADPVFRAVKLVQQD